MKCVLIAIVYLITATNSREFKDYDSDPYDDDDIGIKPYYDLKDAPELFEKFIKDYHKTYACEESKKKHYEIFKENLEVVNKLNHGTEGQTATFDINLFSDMRGPMQDDDDDCKVDHKLPEGTGRADAAEGADSGPWTR